MKRVSNEELPSFDIKKAILKHKKWIVGVVGVLIIWYIFFGGNSGLTQKQFENKLSDLSDGMIQVTNPKIEKLSDEGFLYMADWNGFTITAKVDKKNNFILPYSVLAPQSGRLNEISLGQYQELIKTLSGIADSKLSGDERDHLVLNELNFSNWIINGGDASTSKNGLKYTLSGGGEPHRISTFIIQEKK
ncbi:hypothetical protein MOD25_05520 [Bacillus haynesii]|uniref:hypothetical protein n=1 Tax=Bacillus haynesii TaxID=1925021 RepID=UPI002280C1CF|nr:hypothetical protein [Bacillus haynesii]MCY8549360.1 hypothetical protein [Bacillus haynesii]